MSARIMLIQTILYTFSLSQIKTSMSSRYYIAIKPKNEMLRLLAEHAMVIVAKLGIQT